MSESIASSTEHPLGSLTPEYLRELDESGLEALAVDIRNYLVETLCRTGGHLGPNLGAVELTLALHRVFESPTDAILWDTGHQAYVHKIVTARGGRLPTVRQPGGLSGYPNRSESEHDVIENSHASTALSYAYGLAQARQLGGGHRAIVAVVGDGSLTGGLAYEALSNIGVAGLPVVVVLNDNGRSYAPTVSRLTTADEGLAEAPPAFFSSLGFGYLGPVDGHDVTAVEEALERASAAGGPVVVHVHTRKGEGYPHAAADAEKRMHDVSPFDPETGRALGRGGGSASFTNSFSEAMVRAGEERPELVAITAAMPGSTGLLEFARRFPSRFFDVGIAEQHAVASAAGMAMGGLRPVVAIYSTFLNRAWDQVVHDVALHRLPVVFCIDRAGVTGDDGPSHHGIFDLSLMSKVPGMTVLAPSCSEEVPVMLHLALEHCRGPVALRWPKTPSPGPCDGQVAGPDFGLRARRVREGGDLCLLGAGKMVHACYEAALLLAAQGISAEVWDMRSVRPLDPAMLEGAARHQVVVTAEDGVVEGGVGERVAAALGVRMSPEASPASAASPVVVPCGLPVAFLAHGKPAEILSQLGLDGQGLADRARSALAAVASTGRPRVEQLAAAG